MGELYNILKARSMGGTGSGESYTKAESDAKFVPKDADNKYLTINGIRLYISSTAPTGEIPDGSIGVGWSDNNIPDNSMVSAGEE
jgi:hypothetical protein